MGLSVGRVNMSWWECVEGNMGRGCVVQVGCLWDRECLHAALRVVTVSLSVSDLGIVPEKNCITD